MTLDTGGFVMQGDGHRVDDILWQSGGGNGNVRALAVSSCALDGRLQPYHRDVQE